MSASCGRNRSGDRFYSPPAVRRQLQIQQQQQQNQLLLQKQKLERENEKHNVKQQRSQRQALIVRTKSSAESENRTESDDCASCTTATTSATTRSTPTASLSKCGGDLANLTNLDRFLEYTTPIVHGEQFFKSSVKGWSDKEEEFQPYFVLEDLWESFKEWSAYGAGVPLLLNGSDSVKQYYVPYLSAIQLYVDPSLPAPTARRLGEESDSDLSRASSDGNSDHEAEKGPTYSSQGVTNQQDLVETSSQDIRGPSASSKISNSFSVDEAEFASSPGVLQFEYLEHNPPFSREPLTDKVSILSSHFPRLRTYRSCDLSPASWMSVAWYPIYRIPTGPTLQNLDSCFLTFHSLSTPLHGPQNQWQSQYSSHPREVRRGFGMALELSLPIFGLASYKFKTAVWEQTGANDCPKANSLFQAAKDWLQLMNVNHPDYSFFASHNHLR